MVTSTSTPASMLTMICLTISVGALRLEETALASLFSLSLSLECLSLWLYVLDETLVDAHLVAVPGLGTLTTRGLAGGDLEGLGGQTDGALDAQVLALGALDQLGADLLEGLDLAGGEGDPDLVGLLFVGEKTPVSKNETCCSVVLPRAINRRRRRGVSKSKRKGRVLNNVREPQTLPSRASGKTS
jgi:hypothetical protein